MVRVTIELVPYGSEDNKEVISIIEITNDKTGTAELGNYLVRLEQKDMSKYDVAIKAFPRQELDEIWLLWYALDKLMAVRKGQNMWGREEDGR